MIDDKEREKLSRIILRYIKLRRTVRSYLPDPIPATSLRRIIEAGVHAPVKNNQPKWHAVVLQGEARRAFLPLLKESYSFLSDIREFYKQGYLDLERYQGFVKGFMESIDRVPVMVVVITEKPPQSLPESLRSRELAHNVAGCAMAVENMLLQAVIEGVGGGMLTTVSDRSEEAMLEFLGYDPGEFFLAFVVTLGYPTEWPKAPEKEVDVRWLAE